MKNTLPLGLEQLDGGHRSAADLLDAIPLFADLAAGKRKILAGYLDARETAPGTVIFREGTRADFFCLLVDGALEVHKEGRGQPRRRLAVIHPGKPVGEMAFLDQQPHTTTVFTTARSTLLMLTTQRFAQLSEDHPSLALVITTKLANLLSHRLRQSGLIDLVS